MKIRLLSVFALLLYAYCGNAQTISTIAGNGLFGFFGDGGPASMAEFYSPIGVALDTNGNIYIADAGNNRIRKIDATGTISTFAGNGVGTTGSGSYTGDGGPADSAGLSLPMAVAVDNRGNVYIADAGNNCIRMVNSAGIITTIAGNDTSGYSGDGGPATAAKLRFPAGVTVAPGGSLYIADFSNNRIRKVDTSGIITTVAGNGFAAAIDSGGYSGDGGPADSAALYLPNAVAFDDSMNMYIADSYNNRIRKVTPAGIISTVAGNGNPGYNGDDIPADSASLCAPSSVAFDARGNMYIADDCTNRIRQVSPAGIITTLAGNGILGYAGDGGPASLAELVAPAFITLDRLGNYYIADVNNQCIRFITSLTAGFPATTPGELVTVFPNPSAGDFTVTVPAATKSVITICDLFGRVITTIETMVNTNKIAITLSNQPPGTYLLKVQTAGSCTIKKIMIN